MRLFAALDIDPEIRSRIARFLDGVREFAPEARWVRPESLHVTLKFIGEKSDEDTEEIKRVLATVEGRTIDFNFRDHGFFPTPRSARVFWIGVEGGKNLAALAADIDEKLARLNIAKEEHTFHAHLTLARGGGRGSGAPHKQKADRSNGKFQRLQEKLADRPAPEFGTMTAREFFLFRSQLSPGGSKYTKLAGFNLH